MDDNLPSPDFSKSSTGFLGFSSTPVTEKQFKPKWGKKNRQDNWNRFGQSLGDEERNSGGNFNNPGTHPYQHNNQHRGGGRWNSGGFRGGFRGSYGYNNGGGGEGGYRGGGGGFRGGGGRYNSWGGSRGMNNSWQGQNRNQSSPGGNGGQEGNGYFHPSMLRDPWEELEREQGNLQQSQAHQQSDYDDTLDESGAENHRVLSDSMIPQVGDTLCERNGQLDTTEDLTETDGTKGERQIEDSNVGKEESVENVAT